MKIKIVLEVEYTKNPNQFHPSAPLTENEKEHLEERIRFFNDCNEMLFIPSCEDVPELKTIEFIEESP